MVQRKIAAKNYSPQRAQRNTEGGAISVDWNLQADTDAGL